MWNDILKKGRWKGKIWNRRKNGETYPAFLSISSIRDETGEVTHYCSICHDITGRAVSMEQRRVDTYHDPLTGLPTMQLFYDRLERAFHRAKNDASMIGILVANLNGFRNFNAQYGYRKGDLLLQQVARRLQGACRNDDTLTRSAKDEFIMIVSVEDKCAASVAARADQIMRSFSVPMSIQGSRFRVSIRTGISVYPQDATDMHSLLERAQQKVIRP
jgi:diguanylate cyclase (GGDEF)-like protein